MATNYWLGNATALPQVNTITPANVASTNTFTITCNGKTLTYTAVSGDGVTNVCSGLYNLLTGAVSGVPVPPEFSYLTAALVGTSGAYTAITLTGEADGRPFTQTSSASGGTATLTTSTTTSNSSPSDVDNAANWSAGVPVATQDIVIKNTSVGLLYNLDQLSTIAPNSITIEGSFTGQIGLPLFRASNYEEYLPTYLQWDGVTTSCDIGAGAGTGSARIKLDFGSAAATINVFNMATSADTNLPALLLLGTSASNVLNVSKGSVGVAVLPGETSNVSGGWTASYISNQASDASIIFGSGCTLASGTQNGGAVTINSNSTTVTVNYGTLNFQDGTLTTLNLLGKTTCNYLSTGTMTTANVSGGKSNTAKLDFSKVKQARTVTNCNVYPNATILDPAKTVTWTNGISGVECDPFNDCSLSLGTNLKVTPVTL